jgi:hypothetical protein
MTTIDQLHSLSRRLIAPALPRASQRWGGAGIVIIGTHPEAKTESEWRQIRTVATPHNFELPWLIEALRDAFYQEKRVDSCSKFEFFGRLANAANRCIAQTEKPTPHQLCAAVLHEAFAIYEDMDFATFQSYPVALGNEIVDDRRNGAHETGFVSNEATKEFFKKHGVEIQRDCPG